MLSFDNRKPQAGSGWLGADLARWKYFSQTAAWQTAFEPICGISSRRKSTFSRRPPPATCKPRKNAQRNRFFISSLVTNVSFTFNCMRSTASKEKPFSQCLLIVCRERKKSSHSEGLRSNKAAWECTNFAAFNCPISGGKPPEMELHDLWRTWISWRNVPLKSSVSGRRRRKMESSMTRAGHDWQDRKTVAARSSHCNGWCRKENQTAMWSVIPHSPGKWFSSALISARWGELRFCGERNQHFVIQNFGFDFG